MIDMQTLGNELWNAFSDRCVAEGIVCDGLEVEEISREWGGRTAYFLAKKNATGG